MRDLILEYNNKKKQIKQRLKEFKRLRKSKDEDIFVELSFCILTPQSKAVYCDKAVKELKETRMLFSGSVDDIRAGLKRVRFPNNKAAYLVAARGSFKNGRGLDIKSRLDKNDIIGTRDWLVKNIKGLGCKEASHFLRNIGLGGDLAILDVHILRNLKKYKVVRDIPSSLSRKTYLEIEGKMRRFAEKIKIPLDELDLLFWSHQTGFIFK
ncbi:MAG: N-glycosylase/DNA lyase [Candidatus Omnitrophota bacterium]